MAFFPHIKLFAVCLQLAPRQLAALPAGSHTRGEMLSVSLSRNNMSTFTKTGWE